MNDDAAEYPPGVWLTVCDGCRRWVPGIFLTTFDGKRLCEECAPVAERPNVRPFPPAPDGATCGCGAAAPAWCEGCDTPFCVPCWNRHSHTTTFPVASPDEQSARRDLPPFTFDMMLRLIEFDQQWRYLWLGVAKWKLRDDSPCPVCGIAGQCPSGPDDLHCCANVESALGARDRGGRCGWIHRAKRRRKVA